MKKQVIYALFAVNLLAVIFVALWTYGWIGDYEKEEITSRGTPPQVVDIGSGPNTGTGDPLRTAFNKININFSAVYDSLEKWTDLVNAGVDEQAVTSIVEGVLEDHYIEYTSDLVAANETEVELIGINTEPYYYSIWDVTGLDITRSVACRIEEDDGTYYLQIYCTEERLNVKIKVSW